MRTLGSDPVANFTKGHNAVITGTEGPHARAERREAMARSWKPWSEMFPITGGSGILGVMSTVTAFPFIRHYRKFLSLGTKGVGMHVMFSLVFPAMSLSVIHYMTVTRRLLGYRNICPVCLEMRAGMLQVLGGVLIPMVFCPAVGLFLAVSHVTEAVPNIKHFGETLEFWRKLQKGLGPKMVGLSAFQLALGMFAVKLEFDCLMKIEEKERSIYGREFVSPRVVEKQLENQERSVPVPSILPTDGAKYVVRR